MRGDEGRNSWGLLAMKNNSRTVVGKGEKNLLSDTGSELRLGREKEKQTCEDNTRRMDGRKITKKTPLVCISC